MTERRQPHYKFVLEYFPKTGNQEGFWKWRREAGRHIIESGPRCKTYEEAIESAQAYAAEIAAGVEAIIAEANGHETQ